MTSPDAERHVSPARAFPIRNLGYGSAEAGAARRRIQLTARFERGRFPGSVAISSNHRASRSLTSFACDTRNQCPPGISTASLPGPLARTSRNHRLPESRAGFSAPYKKSVGHVGTRPSPRSPRDVFSTSSRRLLGRAGAGRADANFSRQNAKYGQLSAALAFGAHRRTSRTTRSSRHRSAHRSKAPRSTTPDRRR